MKTIIVLLLACRLLSGLVYADVADDFWKTEQARNPKLTPPVLSVEQSRKQYEQRREFCLSRWTGKEALPVDDNCWRAIVNLSQGKFVAESNERLRKTAADRQASSGEIDFAAIKLVRAYYLFRNGKGLEDASHKAILDFFLAKDFKSKYVSENHELLFHASRYLMAAALPNETFKQYKSTGNQLAADDLKWLTRFIRFRAQCGWGEFSSSGYYRIDMESLLCLYDFAADDELRKLAGMMLDLMWAEVAQDSLNGMHCGAHGRIYWVQALMHGKEDLFGLQYLYFGNIDTSLCHNLWGSCDAFTSSWRPSDVVLHIALDRREPYESRQRAFLFNTDDPLPDKPLEGSIRRYTYWTPQFVVGAVQRQDAYPGDQHAKWYAHHEQHEWDVTIGSRTRSRLFTHHPRLDNKYAEMHGYWTGDLLCNCVSTFASQTVVLALYDIPKDQPCQYIHAYVPKSSFDEVIEENGWIFVREGDVYAGLRMLGEAPRWGTHEKFPNCEVISDGARNGAVCEVGRQQDFGSFEKFCNEIAANKIDFDKEKMTLTYTSKRGGTITIDTRGTRKIDGKSVDLDYGTYDSPFIQSAWKSGIIELHWGDKKQVLDFREVSQTSTP